MTPTLIIFMLIGGVLYEAAMILAEMERDKCADDRDTRAKRHHRR